MGWTHRNAFIAGALAALVVSGCGGSSSPGDAGSGTSSPAVSSLATVADVTTTAAENTTVADAATTTTTPATTVADTTADSTAATTTIDPRPIDPEDEALAQAGELTADTFAAPWTVYSQAGPAPVSTDSCSYRPDGADAKLTNGAAQIGPTMQLGDTGAFVYSYSLAFPDETLAMEHIAILNTDAWSTCFAAQIQKFQTDSGNDYVVNVATRDSPSLNQGGFESYVEFDITSAEGSIDRTVLVSAFRYGREVILQTLEYGSLSDADIQKTFDDSYTALLAAYNRVRALQ